MLQIAALVCAGFILVQLLEGEYTRKLAHLISCRKLASQKKAGAILALHRTSKVIKTAIRLALS
jgi:hypothetical protein